MSSPAPWQLREPVETQVLDASEGRRSLSSFLISGMLMSFLGAILPAWRYHLRADFKEVGYYFLSLNLGFLLSVAAAHVLLPRRGVRVGLGCLVTALLVPGTYYVYPVPSILILFAILPGFFAANYAKAKITPQPFLQQVPLAQLLRD